MKLQGCNRYCGSNFHHKLCENEGSLLRVREEEEKVRRDILDKLALMGCVPRQICVEDEDSRDVILVDRESWKMGISEVPVWRERQTNDLKVEIIDSLLSSSCSRLIEPVSFLIVSRSAIAQDCWRKKIESVVDEKVPWPIIEGAKFDEIALGAKDVDQSNRRVENIQGVLVRRALANSRESFKDKVGDGFSASCPERFRLRAMCLNLKGGAVRSRDCIICYSDVNNLDELASGICRRCRAVHDDVESELRRERDVMLNVRSGQKFDDASCCSFKQSYNMLNSSLITMSFVAVNQCFPSSAGEVSSRPYSFCKLSPCHQRVQLFCCALSSSVPKKDRINYRRWSDFSCGSKGEVFTKLKMIVGGLVRVSYNIEKSAFGRVNLALVASYLDSDLISFDEILVQNRIKLDDAMPHDLKFSYACFILALRLFFNYCGPVAGYEKLWDFVQDSDTHCVEEFNGMAQSQSVQATQSVQRPRFGAKLNEIYSAKATDFLCSQRESSSRGRGGRGVNHSKDKVISVRGELNGLVLRNDTVRWLDSPSFDRSVLSTGNFRVCSKCLNVVANYDGIGFCDCGSDDPPAEMGG